MTRVCLGVTEREVTWESRETKDFAVLAVSSALKESKAPRVMTAHQGSQVCRVRSVRRVVLVPQDSQDILVPQGLREDEVVVVAEADGALAENGVCLVLLGKLAILVCGVSAASEASRGSPAHRDPRATRGHPALQALPANRESRAPRDLSESWGLLDLTECLGRMVTLDSLETGESQVCLEALVSPDLWV